MRIGDKVFVHFSSGVKKPGTVKAVVATGQSGFKCLVVATDDGNVGHENAPTPHYHDRGVSGPYWTQLHEDFSPKPVAAAVDEDDE